MKKSILITLIFLLIATNSYALFESKGVKVAKGHIKTNDTRQAISTLENWVRNEDPTDFDAQWMLAGLYFDAGRYDASAGQYFKALALKGNKKGEVASKFKSAFEKSFSAGDS